MSGNVREKIFWILDFLTGGKKRKHYLEICNDSTSSSEYKLNLLIKYAKEHVPFYKNINASTLADFTVMNKDKYREYDEEMFISDEFRGTKLHTVYTSGSTGTPFKVVQDSEKRTRVKCDLINCHNNIGWRLGDKFVFIRNWVDVYKKNIVKSIIQNVHTVNIATFDEKEKLKLYKWLKKHKSTVIFGYSSAVYEFANYVNANGFDGKSLKIKSIICDSDNLSSSMWNSLKNIFNCPVYNRYDNEENGLLGISECEDSGFKLNTQSLYFEILKLENDEPQEPGLVGRVVVTDLYNHAMPLLRYDTGDLAITYDECDKIKTIYKLIGRLKSCLINTGGRLVSDAEISVVVESFTEIKKYQLIQETEKSFVLNYVGEITNSRCEEMIKIFKKTLGSNADIKTIRVPEIFSGKNGKYFSTVNKMKI